jgi:hypothetical protein
MAIRTGRLYYAKVLGKPVLNYNKDGTEWVFDFAVDRETKIEMEKEGSISKFKEKTYPGDVNEEYVYKLSRRGTKKDGTDAKPIEIVDKDKKPWPKDKLLGNGTKANILYLTSERTNKTGKKYIIRSIMAIQVLDHVPYEAPEREEFEEYSSEEEWA